MSAESEARADAAWERVKSFVASTLAFRQELDKLGVVTRNTAYTVEELTHDSDTDEIQVREDSSET